MNLNDVNQGIVKFKRRKRVGRGSGSGLGKLPVEATMGNALEVVHRNRICFKVVRCRFFGGCQNAVLITNGP